MPESNSPNTSTDSKPGPTTGSPSPNPDGGSKPGPSTDSGKGDSGKR